MQVLLGRQFDASDKLSYAHPEFNLAADWNVFKLKVLQDAGEFSALLNDIPEERIRETFVDD